MEFVLRASTYFEVLEVGVQFLEALVSLTLACDGIHLDVPGSSVGKRTHVLVPLL